MATKLEKESGYSIGQRVNCKNFCYGMFVGEITKIYRYGKYKVLSVRIQHDNGDTYTVFCSELNKWNRKDMETKFWYKDNWVGTTKEFATLEEAREAAQREDGVSITIFANDGGIVEIVKANGYTYP